MKRGDIYWANLIPRSGSEQTGRRPVVIVSYGRIGTLPTAIMDQVDAGLKAALSLL